MWFVIRFQLSEAFVILIAIVRAIYIVSTAKDNVVRLMIKNGLFSELAILFAHHPPVQGEEERFWIGSIFSNLFVKGNAPKPSKTVPNSGFY